MNRRIISAVLACAVAISGMTFPANANDGAIGSIGGSNTFLLTNSARGDGGTIYRFGRTNDQVYVADTNGDGKDEIIVRRGNEFHISGGSGQTSATFRYGKASDEVFFGDWNGDGIDTPAVRRKTTYLVRNSNTSGYAEASFNYGRAGDETYVGSFNGKTDSIAIRRGNRIHIRYSLTSGPANVQYGYGRATDTLLVGDANGNGTDTFHIRRGNTVFVNNTNTPTTSYTFKFANAWDQAMMGDWNGDGVDTIGVRQADTSQWGNCRPLSEGRAKYDTKLRDRVSLVVAEKYGTSYATYTMCQRVPNSEAYRQVWATPARIGARGIARPGEPAAWHTMKTPTGAYSVTESFGTYNPGTKLKHRILTPYSRWGGTPRVNYNQYYNARTPSSSYMSPDENMWYFARNGDYRQGAVINYNRPPDSPIREGMGYAIFLHANPVATAGCIALPEHLVSRYLRETHPGDHMLLGVRSQIFR